MSEKIQHERQLEELQEKEYHAGRLLKSIREYVELPAEKVCYGLCRRRTYQRIESGEREPDKFVLEIFFERLGGSVRMYGITYSLTEYALIDQRNEILYALREGDTESTEELLQAYEEELENIEDRKQEGGKQELHEQFIRYVRAAMRLDDTDVEEELLETLRLTVPGFEIKDIQCFLYGEKEQAILVLLAENACRQGRWQEGVFLYQELLLYLEKRLQDKKRFNELYPEVVLALAEKLAENGQYQELSVCQKGIACLREQHRTYGLEGLIKLSLLGWENGVPVPEGESPELYRKFLDLIEELREEFTVLGWCKSTPYPLLRGFSRGQLLGERILRLRLSLGLTQTDLCTEEKDSERTIGRIERGEEKPNRKRFIRLMKQLGADTCRFYPLVRTENYELFLAAIELEMKISSFCYEEAEKELEKLEKGLDQRDRINRQFCMRERAVIEEHFQRITKEEEIKQLWEALHLTVPEGVDLSLWPLTKAEVEVLNCISITMEEIEDRKGAIELLQRVKKRYEIKMKDLVNFRKEPKKRSFREKIIQYRTEGMKLEYNADAYMLIMDNLESYIGNDGRYEEAKKMAEETLKLAYKMEKCTAISDLLYGITWDKEQMLLQDGKDMASIGEVCLPLYYRSYLLDVILKQDKRAEDTKELCLNKYGHIWRN